MVTFSEAINQTIGKLMEKDEKIFLFGEDIGEYGGAFGVTKGLFDRFGSKRVINSPMSEQAMIGLGTGAAMYGLKPIVEIMFMDFMTLCYDQLFNHAGIFRYISNGQFNVPLVIRTPAGAGRGYGATHSKSLYSSLMQIPGIKVVVPSSVENVAGLLVSSIKDKDPVIFVEHKSLYSIEGEIGEDEIELGKAEVVRNGDDLLIITFGKQVMDCIDIADELEEDGINISVLDLRTLKPLDIKTIKNSVEKIGRVLVVEENYPYCSVGSEIISQINEHCFFSLDAPPKKVCTIDIPIPNSKKLENQVIPNKERIKETIKQMLKRWNKKMAIEIFIPSIVQFLSVIPVQACMRHPYLKPLSLTSESGRKEETGLKM